MQQSERSYSSVTVIIDTGDTRSILIVPKVERVENKVTYERELEVDFLNRITRAPEVESISIEMSHPLPVDGHVYYMAVPTNNQVQDIANILFLCLQQVESDVLVTNQHAVEMAEQLSRALISRGFTINVAKSRKI